MYRNCGRVIQPLNRLVSGVPGSYQQPIRTFFCRRRYPLNSHQLTVFEDSMRDMDRQFQRMEREMDKIFGRRNNFFSRPLGVYFKPVETELVSEGAPSKYELNIHVGENVPPENVKLSLKDRVLTVEAKGENVSEDGSSRVYQEITRKFTLPDNINVTELKSILSPEGILRIEAPFPELEGAKKAAPKEIPIDNKEAPSIENQSQQQQ